MESSSPTTRDFIFESNGEKVCVEVSAEDTLAKVRNLILEEMDCERDSAVFPSGDNFAFKVNGLWILAGQERKRNAFALLDKEAEVKLVERATNNKRKGSPEASSSSSHSESNKETISDGSEAKRRKLNASTSVTPTTVAKTNKESSENDAASPVDSRQNLASNFAKAQSSPPLTASKNGDKQREESQNEPNTAVANNFGGAKVRRKFRNGTNKGVNNPSYWCVDVFRPFVQRALDEWKQDSLFTEIGLLATDTILRDNEKVPGEHKMWHPWNLFSTLIVKKIADEFKLKKEGKKTMKIMFKSFLEEWKVMIREKQIQSPSKNVDLSPKQRQMKEEFERTKREVLDSLPEEVKSMFGEQFFSKWGKSFLPCLVLSPYSVPPGGIRDMWFDMYEKLKKQDRLAPATNLVYWYGFYDDPRNAYSFVATYKLTTYAEGEKKNMHKVPNPIQKKLDTKKKLNAPEKMLVEGLAEMAEDRGKEPDARHGRMAFLDRIGNFQTEQPGETRKT